MGPLVLCRARTHGLLIRTTPCGIPLQALTNKYWHAARQAQPLSTTDLSGTDIRQTRPRNLGAQFREPMFAVRPRRDLIRLHAFVRRLSVGSVPWRNMSWLSSNGIDHATGRSEERRVG